MSEATELERAILARAERLAEEFRERGIRNRDAILREAADQLRLLEERENASLRTLGERRYRQGVQAEELRLQGHLDLMRWNLVRAVERRLAERIQAQRENPNDYLEILIGWIQTAAQEIECDQLLVSANAEDLALLRDQWSAVEAAMPEGKQLRLLETPIQILAGVLVTDKTRRIRVDNSFEGRSKRLGSLIEQRILEELLPQGLETGSVFGG